METFLFLTIKEGDKITCLQIDNRQKFLEGCDGQN